MNGSLDVSRLPSYTFGSRSTLWWATAAMIAIEGTVFALAVASYFYLRSQSVSWPQGVPPPDVMWGSVNLLVMLASGIPNHWTIHRAKAHDLRGARIGMLVCLVFAAAFLGIRVLEYRSLNVGWDYNAYGSIVWLIMSLHSLHLITDFIDSAVLTVLLHTGPLEGRRFADVADNGGYWDFVVLAWIPLYVVIYWSPRL
jgi:cytochrome c oxidase subunit 3